MFYLLKLILDNSDNSILSKKVVILKYNQRKKYFKILCNEFHELIHTTNLPRFTLCIISYEEVYRNFKGETLDIVVFYNFILNNFDLQVIIGMAD